MDTNNQTEIQESEARIRALFAQCKVPKGNSDERVKVILKKSLYELSLRELIDFSVKIISTMWCIAAGENKTFKKGNKE